MKNIYKRILGEHIYTKQGNDIRRKLVQTLTDMYIEKKIAEETNMNKFLPKENSVNGLLHWV